MWVRPVGPAAPPRTAGSRPDRPPALVRPPPVRPLLRCRPAVAGARLPSGAGPSRLGRPGRRDRPVGVRHRPLCLLRRTARRILQRLHRHPGRPAAPRLAPRRGDGESGRHARGPSRMNRWYGIRRLYEPAFRERVLLLLLIVIAAFGFMPVYLNLKFQQVATVWLLLVTAALWAALRRRSGLAGAFIATAASLKVSPVFLIPLFARLGRWRVAVFGSGALIAATAVTVLAAPGSWQFFTLVLPRIGLGTA